MELGEDTFEVLGLAKSLAREIPLSGLRPPGPEPES